LLFSREGFSALINFSSNHLFCIYSSWSRDIRLKNRFALYSIHYDDCYKETESKISDPEKSKSQSYVCIITGNSFDTTFQIRKGCEDEVAPFDPISSLPITNMRTGFTFKNYYCALCNNQTFTDRMELWSPRLECPSVGKQGEQSLINDTFNNRLIYRPDQGKWGLQLRHGDHDIFHACNIDPFVSPTVEYIIRPCKPSIKDCPSNYTNNDVSDISAEL
jgi:hypothetical protein